MKLLLITVLVAAVASPSTWVTPVVRAPRLQFRTFDSAAAKTKVSYHIYTPESYDTDKERRFPVLYWLHGSGGGLLGIRPLVEHFNTAIGAGKIPPMLVVFVNGLVNGMYCDWNGGNVPLETVIIKELVPHIDATFRTIASREGRLIEGFSMGGYGAGRLGFKHHNLFGAVSILGGGPLDLDFKGPRTTAKPQEREHIFKTVWGGDIEYYRAQSPWVLAEQNKTGLAGRTRLRLAVGDRDGMLPPNQELSAHLARLGIRHDFLVLRGVGHDALAALNALGDANWNFYAAAKEDRRLFFAFSKAMIEDSVSQQQRGWDAVQSIKGRLEPLGFASHILQEPVRSHDEYAKNPFPFLITRNRIVNELESCRQNLGSNDTIIVYSHSHGVQGRSGKLGGLPLDDPGAKLWRPAYLDWREYAGQLLALPARTVVVLTMACHSGGLVEFLNNDEKTKNLWQTRKEQGRNFLVITSQKNGALSNPRRIEGKLINPFTYAVIKAFEGQADGYQRGNAGQYPDGKMTLGELVEFVMDETRKHTRSEDAKNDPDPQTTGSYDPEFVIAPPASSGATPAAVQDDPPRWVTPVVRAPRLQFRTFDSAAAKTKVSYHIYTPESYDTEKTRRFPVLYWLHGSGGGLPGVPQLVAHFDAAIRTGKTPPMLVVFVNGLRNGMWCDSKDGKRPVETIVIKELLPHIDATFRTIAAREGRIIEGFSMGGYGAGRLGFKYPELFCAISMLGAGPLQPELNQAPRVGAQGREQILQDAFGGDMMYFKAQSPWMLAARNAGALRGKCPSVKSSETKTKLPHSTVIFTSTS